MGSYKIPKEVSAELRLNKFMYITDLAILLAIFVLRMITIDYVHSEFRVWYTVFLAFFGLFIIIRPLSNPEKRMYEAMMIALARKRETYVALDYSEGEEIKRW